MKDQRFVDGHEFVISNLPVKYAYVQQPDTMFDPCWKLSIVLTPEWQKALKDVGFNVRQDKAGDFTLVVKSKCTRKDGTKNKPPRVFDMNGEKFTEELGDGSICDVAVYAKYIKVSGKTHLPAYLNAVRVRHHVPKSTIDWGDDSSDDGSLF